jgi:hypothetical protein
MSEAPPTHRRCFRYSLRMLFVVVTVLAVFLAYPVNRMRERHQFLAEEEARLSLNATELIHNSLLDSPKTPLPSAPRLLRLLGEPGHSHVNIQVDSIENSTDRDIERAKRAKLLFPEASINQWSIGESS